ncbi:ATP-NAD kinase family protein [Desulfocurvus sp. DL9XJH121]
MSIAGIVANPASGKDIRRLVAHGSVFDNQEKVRMVRRLILGLEQAGVSRVLYMPDAYGIVPRALNAIEPGIPVEPIGMRLTGTQEDTVRAAEIMAAQGAGVLLVLGGDGTSRAVCKGTVSVPLAPLSTGTNNVFPVMAEATVAGLAAGLVATGRVPPEAACTRACMFEILVDGEAVDVALVDAAVFDGVFMASRAVWEMERVPQVFLTRCRADAIGLSSIGGQLTRIEPQDPRGLALELTTGPGALATVTAAIAPGMFARVGVDRATPMLPGEIHEVGVAPCIVAVDGEREVEVRRRSRAAVRLTTDGPRVVDVARVMDLARERELFINRQSEKAGETP